MPGPNCPATAPNANDSCTIDQLGCSYGHSVLPCERQQLLCTGGVWTPQGSCSPTPADQCPASPPTTGTQCSTNGARCGYSDGTICGCTNCPAGPCTANPAAWDCAPPTEISDCPRTVPNNGTRCDDEGLTCSYGDCGVDTAYVSCEGVEWVWQPPICPN